MADPELTTLLNGVGARIARAEEQAADLARQVRVFTRANTHKFVLEKEPDGSEYRMRIFFDPKPDWVRLGVLFGEFVHNCRSALDNLAYALVIANGGTPTSRTEFPIFKDRPKFEEWGCPKVRGMSSDVVAEIERLQPFNPRGYPPDAHPLWVLHRLNVVDKHHLILPVIFGKTATLIGVPDGCSFTVSDPVEDGAVILTVIPPSPTHEMNVKANFIFEVGVKFGSRNVRLFVLAPKVLKELRVIQRTLCAHI